MARIEKRKRDDKVSKEYLKKYHTNFHKYGSNHTIWYDKTQLLKRTSRKKNWTIYISFDFDFSFRIALIFFNFCTAGCGINTAIALQLIFYHHDECFYDSCEVSIHIIANFDISWFCATCSTSTLTEFRLSCTILLYNQLKWHCNINVVPGCTKTQKCKKCL